MAQKIKVGSQLNFRGIDSFFTPANFISSPKDYLNEIQIIHNTIKQDNNLKDDEIMDRCKIARELMKEYLKDINDRLKS